MRFRRKPSSVNAQFLNFFQRLLSLSPDNRKNDVISSDDLALYTRFFVNITTITSVIIGSIR